MGADPQQTLVAFREAEAYDGPSLVIAYSHCIAHGFEMRLGLISKYRRWPAATGRWFATTRCCAPRRAAVPAGLATAPGCHWPTIAYRELRYRSLVDSDPDEAERLLALAEESMDQRWRCLRGDGHPRRQHFPADARRED